MEHRDFAKARYLNREKRKETGKMRNRDVSMACRVPCETRRCVCNAFGYCLDVDPCDKRRTQEEEQEFRDSITEEV